MAISQGDIVKGGIYVTSTTQLIKVIAIEEGKVQYLSKGGNTKYATHPWARQYVTPPSIETFLEKVDHCLTRDEISEFIAKRVLPSEDLE